MQLHVAGVPPPAEEAPGLLSCRVSSRGHLRPRSPGLCLWEQLHPRRPLGGARGTGSDD